MIGTFKDFFLTEETKVYRRLPTSRAIKIPLPDVRQSTSFSCGAATLHSICKYFGAGPEEEEDFIKELGTDDKDGTSPEEIVTGAKKHGLRVILRHNMTVKQVKHFIDSGKPVILNIQAWGNKKDYNDCGSGHYATAIGYDSKGIYFQDPSISGMRGFLKYEDLENRWHDKETSSKRTDHLGIVIWKNRKPVYCTHALHIS